MSAACAATLITVQLLTRASTLTEFDSTNFALALRHFDVFRDQPHPPGYPLFVAAAHLVGWLGEPLEAYLALALAFSIGAIIATAWLAREMFGRRAALIAPALLVATPVFLYYAGIVSVYPTEAFFAPLVGLLAYRVTLRRHTWSAPLLPVVLAIGSGFRPSMLVLLAPMCLLAVSIGRPPWRPLLVGLAVAAAIVAGWAIPTVVKAGGLSRYLEASRLYESAAQQTSFVFNGNGVRNAALATAAIALAALPSALVAALFCRRVPRDRGHQYALLAAWIVPYIVLFGFIHFGKPGYSLGFLPALCVGAAGLADERRAAVPASFVVAATGIAYFLFIPMIGLPHAAEVFRPFAFAPTADSIRAQDAEAETLEELAASCPASSCSVVSLGSSLRVWNHDPWSLHRWYTDIRLVRVCDLKTPNRLRGTAVWLGAQPPAEVVARANRRRDVGTWHEFVSTPRVTAAIVASLERDGVVASSSCT